MGRRSRPRTVAVPVVRPLGDVVFGGQPLGDLSEAVPLSVQLASSRR